MTTEHRLEQREPVALPMVLPDGSTGITRDISLSGLYLQLDGHHELGGTIFFEMDLAAAHMKFTSEGRIVRIEHRDGSTGVAIQLTSPRLQPLP
ncbi:MAG: PilZ domain-containing protein [Pseudomonadota bacterium]